MRQNYPINRRLARQKNQPWDECDPIATAILRLIRAQNMLQGVHHAISYVDVAEAKYKKAYAARESAMLQLIAAREAFKYEQAVEEQDRWRRVQARRPRLRLVVNNENNVRHQPRQEETDHD
jgi:hypothetical protein